MKDKINTYLLNELYREVCERDQHDVDKYTKFFYDRVREFYWTLSRLVGLAHLHDGSWRSATGEKAELARPLLQGDIPIPATHPRVLIDVTPTHCSGGQTGVQRVVREIARAAVESGDGLPVFIEDGRLLSHFRHPSLPDRVDIAKGDKFLMLDVCWNHIEA